MTICAQRDGVRVYGFRKSGHTSIINTFLSTGGEGIEPGVSRPLVRNTSDEVKELGAYRGEFFDRLSWPKAEAHVAFVREPIRRTLSAYMHFMVRSHRPTFRQMGFKDYDMTFDDFCTHLLNVDLSLDPHLTPQMEYLFQTEEEETFILAQLEVIQFAWGPIMEELNIDCPRTVAWVNKGDYDPDKFITPYSREVVNSLYVDDLVLWRSIDETRARFSTERNQIH